jgi:hypothetical protein
MRSIYLVIGLNSGFTRSRSHIDTLVISIFSFLDPSGPMLTCMGECVDIVWVTFTSGTVKKSARFLYGFLRFSHFYDGKIAVLSRFISVSGNLRSSVLTTDG